MSRIEKAIERAAKLREAREEPPLISKRSAQRENREKLTMVEPVSVTSPYLVAINGHAAAEEYRKLKSIVVGLNKRKHTGNTLAVTSALSEEGKSLVSLNLALTLAQDYDRTVLLVDSDLRRPSLHRYLGLNPEVGLVQCLKDGVDLSRAMIKTGLGKLVLLPSGGTAADPVELFASDRMRELVREMKERYPDRFVIFDTPPALPFADARVLAATLDGVIFVVREGCARFQQVKDALTVLKGLNLLGVVFNDASSVLGRAAYSYNHR